MEYKISKVTQELVDEQVVRTILTLEVTYGDSSMSTHGFILPEGGEVGEFAVECAAELEKVLKEPVGVIYQEIELTDIQKEISSEAVEAKLAAI